MLLDFNLTGLDQETMHLHPHLPTSLIARLQSGTTLVQQDLSFHTAMDCLLPLESLHVQSAGGNDATKSIPTSPSPLLEDDLTLISQHATSSPSCLTHQNVVILDNAFEAVDYGDQAEPVVSVPYLPLGSHICPRLKESIHKAVQYHVKKYACQLDASLSNQLEWGLSEAIDFTLNIIEWPLTEMHPLMPGTWEQSQSQL
ncbi:hypothetical protein EDC04DRAFT_2616923 [Pisolithus marmoratus]|nr:hypothetical protein EDC04DRAFT_2616923 [Pisolithus marmoratus]